MAPNQAFGAATEIDAVLRGPVSDAHRIKFQCPQCGQELEQSIGSPKLSAHMRCKGCGVGINIDTDCLANAAEEMRRALEKVSPGDHPQANASAYKGLFTRLA
jgi:predicted RNA-binding Zn-ribbon protein involved in translation (DUF1610 family)